MEKRWVSILATAVAVSSLVGCAGEKSVDNQDVPTISATIYDRGRVPASEGTYENNRWTRWINEQSGVTVNWVPIPRGDSRKKISLLVASGDSPDLIIDYDPNIIAMLVKQNAVLPLDDFIDEYSTVYKKYLQEHPDVRPETTYDGKMYSITSETTTNLNMGAWIRQDWLDKLGLSMPETDQDLLEVARAFRDGDPDGNGQDDTIAIAAMNWHEIFPSIFQANGQWYNEEGLLKFGSTLDRYADALAYHKQLYDEGLIDQEFITDKDSQNQRRLWATGKSGILTYNWESATNKELMQNDPSAKLVPLKPVSSKYGLNAFHRGTGASFLKTAFSKDIKNPEAAMKFIDWMLETAWFNIRFGLEGEHYTLSEDGIPQIIDLEKSAQEVDYAYEYAPVIQLKDTPEWIMGMAAKDPLSQKLARQKAESLVVNSAVPFRLDVPVMPLIDQVEKVISDFSPLRDDIRMRVITGGDAQTPEMGLEQIRKEWNRLGGEEAERLMTEWFNNN